MFGVYFRVFQVKVRFGYFGDFGDIRGAELCRHVRILAMDGDLTTVRLS